MLFNDTILLVPAPVADSRFTKVGLSDFAVSLLSDAYQSINASVAEQEQIQAEMQASLALTEQAYAEKHVTLEQVQLFLIGNPDTTFTANEIRLKLAKEQRDVLSALLPSGIPRSVVDGGTITTKLLVSFSQTENVVVDGTLLPKTLVRPPSPRSAEIITSSGLAAELELNFKVITQTEK